MAGLGDPWRHSRLPATAMAHSTRSEALNLSRLVLDELCGLPNKHCCKPLSESPIVTSARFLCRSSSTRSGLGFRVLSIKIRLLPARGFRREPSREDRANTNTNAGTGLNFNYRMKENAGSPGSLNSCGSRRLVPPRIDDATVG